MKLSSPISSLAVVDDTSTTDDLVIVSVSTLNPVVEADMKLVGRPAMMTMT